MHEEQTPHDRKLITTWSPGFTFVTRLPTFSTTPDPSCPKTAGSGIGMNPACATRSVWQTPQPYHADQNFVISRIVEVQFLDSERC